MDADSLHRALLDFAGKGNVEVFEQGRFLPQLTKFQHEVKIHAGRVMLQLWTEEATLVRQVISMDDASDGRLALSVKRFGKTEAVPLEFVHRESSRPPGRLSREKFRVRLQQILQEQFPDETVESLTSAQDLEHSFSGNFSRGLMRRGAQQWALLAAGTGESPATLEGALTFGLLWLDYVRTNASRRAVAGLRLVLPETAVPAVAFRMQALDRSAGIELFAYEETTWHFRRVSVSDSGNIATWMTPLREVQRTLDAARADVQPIVALSPQAIDCMVPPGTKEVALRFRGLEFARWKNGEVVILCAGERERLTPAKFAKLKKWIAQLAMRRQPQATDTAHPLFRAQAERWLETLLLHDPARLDARLDSRFLYSQVPAFSSTDRGVLDLLGMTRDGRLVVIELKASQDLHLPLQAADYWLRVRAHQLAGDFPRHGYFVGAELQDSPPRLYLVAPGFQFHPSTDTVLRYLSREISVVRIGLNEKWREQVQVIFRM